MKNSAAKLFAGLTLCLVAYIAIKNTWYSNAFSGVVVDPQNRPISGGVVLVAWQSREFLTGSQFTYVVKEAISDDRGVFRIEGWGPRLSSRFLASLDGTQPSIWVVSRGYFPHKESGGRQLALGAITLNASPPKGNIRLQLEPLPPQVDARTKVRIEGLAVLARGLGTKASSCLWKQAKDFELKFSEVEVSVGAERKWFSSESIKTNSCEE